MLDEFRTTTKALAAVELATLLVMVEENPGNEYWQERLDEFQREINPAAEAYQMEQANKNTEADESAEIDNWLNSDSDSDSDPRTPAQIDVDQWQAESALTRESDRPY